MHRINKRDLPFLGSSWSFVGDEQGGAPLCAYLIEAPRGKGPVLHTHPYDTVAFVQSGKAVWTIDGQDVDAGPGDIVIVEAGSKHRFVSTGDEPLVAIDVHPSGRFEQTNL